LRQCAYFVPWTPCRKRALISAFTNARMPRLTLSSEEHKHYRFTHISDQVEPLTGCAAPRCVHKLGAVIYHEAQPETLRSMGSQVSSAEYVNREQEMSACTISISLTLSTLYSAAAREPSRDRAGPKRRALNSIGMWLSLSIPSFGYCAPLEILVFPHVEVVRKAE
jgi:hypothetical protein